jgi:hypothetical protein
MTLSAGLEITASWQVGGKAHGRSGCLPVIYRDNDELASLVAAVVVEWIPALGVVRGGEGETLVQPALPHWEQRLADVASGYVRVEATRRHMAMRLREILLSERWNLGFSKTSVDMLVDQGELGEINWLPDPPGHDYRADPFWLVDEGIARTIFEKYDQGKDHGYIMEGEWQEESWIEWPSKGLPSDSHSSFPYTVYHAGETYCLPERQVEGSLTIWRATLDGWVRHCTLLKERAIDATLIWFDDLWWVLYSLEGPLRNTCLYVAWAESLEGPWRTHPKNPVVTNAATARNGGRTFVHRGNVYRFAQDCTRRYGGSCVLIRVSALSRTDYQQEVMWRFEPDSHWPSGLHSIDVLEDGRCVVDGMRYEFDFKALARKIAKRLGRTSDAVAGRAGL